MSYFPTTGNPPSTCDRRTLTDIWRAAELIRSADALVIAAGAGMGVDSGLPDFRGPQGFWRAYPALGRLGIDFYRAACPDTFYRDIRLAWGFYGHRLALYRATEPHEGFAMLQQWGAAMPNGFRIFTSNVDGQFQKAGVPEERITECHGSIHHLQCLQPCCNAIWPADAVIPDVDADLCQWQGEIPACPHCGGPARPNILMFGDSQWVEDRTVAQLQRLDDWLKHCQRPVVIELGAGKDVATVRNFCERTINYHSGHLIRINPREWQVKRMRDVGLAAGALEALQAISRELQ